jgi:hypothetical protein
MKRIPPNRCRQFHPAPLIKQTFKVCENWISATNITLPSSWQGYGVLFGPSIFGNCVSMTISASGNFKKSPILVVKTGT